jgi:lipopolysaccharide/colanic/teichoic acid biosynthesis glycosyltransferase
MSAPATVTSNQPAHATSSVPVNKRTPPPIGSMALTSPMRSTHGSTPIVHVPVGYLRFKRVFDLVVGSVLAILLLPMIIITAIIVRLTSHGPAFYVQTRTGVGGRAFRIYKLRSMVQDAEKAGAKWSTKGDPRVTKIGWFLRKSHMDEFPQILNVLRGEMSLVGPRPERPEFIPMLEAALPHYRDRLLIRPGITGLAQVYLPPDTDVNSVRKKLAYDLRYIQAMNLWLDMRLMVATAWQAAGIPPVVVRLILWLDRPEVVEARPLAEPELSNPNPATAASS